MKEQQVVLITGCSTGMGKEMCEILSNRGYHVVATARNKSTLEDVPASLRIGLDVTDSVSVEDAIKQVVNKFGKIDILVNNAGYSVRGALEEVPINEMKQIFDVNVFGIVQMLQAVLPHMRGAGGGKIINIGSVSGKFAQAINGGYCASKHAVEAMSDALRLELQPFGIQSSVIEPGPIQTNFFQTLANKSDVILENQDSPYQKFYFSDINYRKKQPRSDAKIAAKEICDILEKEKLRPRYQVAVPRNIRFLLRLSDVRRERMQMR